MGTFAPLERRSAGRKRRRIVSERRAAYDTLVCSFWRRGAKHMSAALCVNLVRRRYALWNLGLARAAQVTRTCAVRYLPFRSAPVRSTGFVQDVMRRFFHFQRDHD